MPWAQASGSRGVTQLTSAVLVGLADPRQSDLLITSSVPAEAGHLSALPNSKIGSRTQQFFVDLLPYVPLCVRSVLVPHQRHAEGTHVAPVAVSLETETRAVCSRFGSCILGGAEWSQETETRGACSRLGNCTPSGAERAHAFPVSSWSPWQRHAKEDRFTPTGLAEHRDACSHW
ncbi:hypothetical protein NDU88_004421 [Pleurodeles waltl]|uniref:Uncharacterized protein n=1 Tax=Pleurodeles waltl TaxID=8319 RepID=A0AAV7RFP5_PLEWA|nr:hypothetical protein NDU88_004421 [Pleurodeles waltl]